MLNPIYAITVWATLLSGLPLVAADYPKPDPVDAPIASGPVQANWDSLSTHYQCPEWFRDAKFGIWAHWGPQSVPEQGDWYARQLYIQTNHWKFNVWKNYDFHVKTYGHPSTFGYKDILPLWQAEKWDPDALMSLYKRSGARYFCAQANHHENFDNWNSKYQEWNSVNMGPKRDVVGEWKKAADKQSLPFGVTVHTGDGYRWAWWAVAFGSDETGPLKGVPYDAATLTKADGKGKWWDGYDPEHLYGPHRILLPSDITVQNIHVPMEDAPRDYQDWWAARINNLVNNYHPDLLYFDGSLPWSSQPDAAGLRVTANFMNRYATAHQGKLEGIITLKDKLAEHPRAATPDYEQRSNADIAPEPWQSDTSIGDWYFNKNWKDPETGTMYSSPRVIIANLIDIVSKNGNMLLNVIQHPDGSINTDVITLLNQIGGWLAINGEGIYATRPWKVSGEGPTKVKGGGAADEKFKRYTAQNIRFTNTKDGKALYAFCLGAPQGDIVIQSLGSGSGKLDKPISAVALLGGTGDLQWKQNTDALVIKKPAIMPLPGMPVGFKITLKD